jgi:hypothetical protein
MIPIAKHIFLILGLTIIIFSFSEKSMISVGGTKQSDSENIDAVKKCDSVNCNYHKNMENVSPDYVPPECGKCNGKWNNYRHRDLMNERDCYFGKGIKK